jgi:hypothetical protein
MRYYILEGRTPRPVSMETYLESLTVGGEFAPHIAKTDIYPRGPEDGKIHISTVFLSLDHGWGSGPPVLFETMIFPDTPWNLPLPDDTGAWNDAPALSDFQERYTTWDAAEHGHKAAVELVHMALSRLEKEGE